ncbi:MAG TPA: ABC transporter permease [Candidatus Limnocylindrales bacterium]|jgi:fructose transport system permease protein|nr:ABC transporter permease [Candidatus Limnocylindrales bacterium]
MTDVQPTTIDPAEQFLHRMTPIQRVHSVLHHYPALSPAVVLLLAAVVLGAINNRFFDPRNLSLVAQQVAVVGALAIGQTLIILTAGIDLSVGAVMVFTSIVMTGSVVNFGVPGPLALLIGLVFGTLAGGVNGLLVTRLRLPPFIVTLGTLNIFTALTLLYSGGQTIQSKDIPDILLWTGQAIDFGPFRITTGVILMLAMYVVATYVLRNTAWGRHIYAVGDDREAARLAGIAVNRILLSAYLVAGFIFAVTAWILIGRVGAASPNAASDANLDSITAVVIGGTSLFGGRGLIIGSLLGALIVGVFRNGLALAGVDVLWQTLVVGVLVIVAVATDQWIRRVRA